jgi:hypothetical protein
MNYLSILAIMKNEAMNLKIWIDHYIWQGVDHIYIIDNNSDDNSVEIINDLINNNYPITLYILPEQHKQTQHYQYVYDKENLKENTRWLIVADLDEFFYCNNSKISDELKNYQDYDFITSKWRMFGSNNCIQHPKDIRINLTKRVEGLHSLTKYIFQTKNIDSRSLGVHYLNDGYTNDIDLSEIFRLNHYPIQSKEYFGKVKMLRGDVHHSTHTTFRDWNYFDAYNVGTSYNDEDLKNMVLNKNNNNNIIINCNDKYSNNNYYIILFFIIVIGIIICYLITNDFKIII